MLPSRFYCHFVKAPVYLNRRRLSVIITSSIVTSRFASMYVSMFTLVLFRTMDRHGNTLYNEPRTPETSKRTKHSAAYLRLRSHRILFVECMGAWSTFRRESRIRVVVRSIFSTRITFEGMCRIPVYNRAEGIAYTTACRITLMR